MKSNVLFASVAFDKYDASVTLPAKFGRLIDESGLEKKVKSKTTAIKMHVGRGTGFTTIHPMFVKMLVDKLKGYGAEVFITDQTVADARMRGYTEELLGCPILDVCGFLGKYVYEREVDFKTFKNVDIGGYIQDADVMIDFSHVKGHGACGFGGACKNIAMGCVTDRTRQQLHALEGGLAWDGEKCTHCKLCLNGCNHKANKFTEDGKYEVFFHDCTYCQHCVKVCPTGAIRMDGNYYKDFQTGMALCTKTVLDTFAPGNVYYINFLTNITALCDCWGFTTPPIVPDIGIMASDDMVAVERASIDAIKVENALLNGIPTGHKLLEQGHLLERIHGKNPYVQLDELEKLRLGSQEYELKEIG
ncbi:MAG: DUF362 domain-containing protein [Clostridiales bacterium]|jgi:uncharacterized Fe-S center protein|nr:DUF362 domain-containing protein [Clostridiales bacterium]